MKTLIIALMTAICLSASANAEEFADVSPVVKCGKKTCTTIFKQNQIKSIILEDGTTVDIDETSPGTIIIINSLMSGGKDRDGGGGLGGGGGK